MATVLDVFNSDYFGLLSLTDGINKMKFQPGRIGQMGIFQEIPIATLTVALEERDGIINLISPSARGGPGQTLTKSLRTARAIRTAHFQVDDAIMAEEVQGVRVFGSENATEAVMTKVAERQQVAGVSLEATLEYARIGAVKGIVTYAELDDPKPVRSVRNQRARRARHGPGQRQPDVRRSAEESRCADPRHERDPGRQPIHWDPCDLR